MGNYCLIKRRLKETREIKKFSRSKVCQKTNIPKCNLEDWEMNGTLPRLDKAKILAELY